MDDKLLQLYFEGATTDEQSRLITEWLDASTAHMQHYQRLCRLYEIGLWHEHPAQAVAAPTHRIAWRSIGNEVMKVAAILIIGFMLNNWLSALKGDEKAAMQTIHVPAGQNAQLTLADGSKVWLNAGSTLHFPTHFVDGQRLVNLEGEGFFEVTANKEKPFIVSTSRYAIKALGTSFNVHAYKQSNDFETALLSGVVEVSNHANTQTVILLPNTRVVLSDNKLTTLPIQSTDYFLWREGIICFNEPLAEVLDKLELYFNIEIQVNNERTLQNKQYCVGKFRTRDGLDHILNVLQLTHHFSYTKDEEKNLIHIN